MAAAKAINLTCEYESGNLGIDTRVPRFSWWMDDSRPGAVQSGYQIRLEGPGANELWDSGEVKGSDSVLVEYGGAPLESRTRYTYRVRIRDHQDQWSGWSEDWFETAFLADEWQAKWIAPTDDEPGGPAPYLRARFER
ncbi:MAG TPA: alpha-L-rhamnosidase, partial [Spirochaetia bacterium]|nr:alpha-L-rhamnosidase [Spirochaetia bacterium]